jgi:hypothetical protein
MEIIKVTQFQKASIQIKHFDIYNNAFLIPPNFIKLLSDR